MKNQSQPNRYVFTGCKFEKVMTHINIFLDKRGLLVPVEHKELPFVPQRTFVVCNVPVRTERGNHAHYKCRQFAVVVAGMIKFDLDDGKNEQSVILKAGESILIEKMIWDSQTFVTPGAVLLVFCSIPYSKDDYITDYETFKKLTA